MKAMAYIKKEACSDLALQDFTKQWSSMSSEDQEQLREWAREEGKIVGVEVE